MRKLPAAAAEDLLEIVMRRYERASTIVTSNRPIDDWPKLFGDTPAVAAFLDPLMHHSHLIEIRGKSYRLHESILAARGRKALAPGRRPTQAHLDTPSGQDGGHWPILNCPWVAAFELPAEAQARTWRSPPADQCAAYSPIAASRACRNDRDFSNGRGSSDSSRVRARSHRPTRPAAASVQRDGAFQPTASRDAARAAALLILLLP